jgi:hypothetical protein
MIIICCHSFLISLHILEFLDAIFQILEFCINKIIHNWFILGFITTLFQLKILCSIEWDRKI